MPYFSYHSEIIERYPEVVGGIIFASGVHNGPTTEALQVAYLAEQQATLARIGDTPLSELETLSAWRSAFRDFGVNPTKYRSAPEALLRRLTKKGDIPSINTLVDTCNLLSIRYAIPVAAMDIAAATGGITVHFAARDEHFTPLGVDEAEHPEPGEVVFSDETALVFARRWCWRQSAESAAQPGTTDAILTIETMHAGGRGAVEAALADILPLLEVYTGGTYQWSILDKDNPRVEWV
jgi:DNA/RNA-binding domain of Phe-tRNA-synthetase-like protein